MPIKIFFCYAREDEALLNKLKTHLRPFERQGVIDLWNDRDIRAGADWEHEINRHLNDADVILLLVSPDFMESDYCYGKEMQRALERHAQGECVVVPIILRPVYWYGEPLGKLQALPTDGKPVTGGDWHDQDSAFFDVVAGIHHVLENIACRVALKSFSFVQALAGHQGLVRSVALSSDSQTLASGSADRMIKVWEVSSGKELLTLAGHGAPVCSVALSADGTTLVSGSDDRTIKLWEVSSGKELRTLAGHQGAVCSVALSADGTTLVSGSDDRTISVWKAEKKLLFR